VDDGRDDSKRSKSSVGNAARRGGRDKRFAADVPGFIEMLKGLGLVLDGDAEFRSEVAKDLDFVFDLCGATSTLESASEARRQGRLFKYHSSIRAAAECLRSLQSPLKNDLDATFLARLGRRLGLERLDRLDFGSRARRLGSEYQIYSLYDLPLSMVEEIANAAADVSTKHLVQNEPWVARVGQPSASIPGWSSTDRLVAMLGERYLKWFKKRPWLVVYQYGEKAGKKGGKFVAFVRASCERRGVSAPSPTVIGEALRKARKQGGWRLGSVVRVG
jgi:hypothetical protein